MEKHFEMVYDRNILANYFLYLEEAIQMLLLDFKGHYVKQVSSKILNDSIHTLVVIDTKEENEDVKA